MTTRVYPKVHLSKHNDDANNSVPADFEKVGSSMPTNTAPICKPLVLDLGKVTITTDSFPRMLLTTQFPIKKYRKNSRAQVIIIPR